jgi:hypothetical protein
VVEGAFVGAADIHAGFFADGFEAFEFAEFGGVVFRHLSHVLNLGDFSVFVEGKIGILRYLVWCWCGFF